MRRGHYRPNNFWNNDQRYMPNSANRGQFRPTRPFGYANNYYPRHNYSNNTWRNPNRHGNHQPRIKYPEMPPLRNQHHQYHNDNVALSQAAQEEENQPTPFSNITFPSPGYRPYSDDQAAVADANFALEPFDKSIGSTVDTVKKRLQHRKDHERSPIESSESLHHEEPVVLTKENFEISKQIPPPRRRSEGHKRSSAPSLPSKENYDEMKNKIVRQLFKTDKKTLHKIITNPQSSTKFDHAIHALLTESRNSLNRHLRNAADRSLMHENMDTYPINNNDTVYEDTFLREMRFVLDPQDTVNLYDMKPAVMAEINKVLQINDNSVHGFNSVVNNNSCEIRAPSPQQDPIVPACYILGLKEFENMYNEFNEDNITECFDSSSSVFAPQANEEISRIVKVEDQDLRIENLNSKEHINLRNESKKNKHRSPYKDDVNFFPTTQSNYKVVDNHSITKREREVKNSTADDTSDISNDEFCDNSDAIKDAKNFETKIPVSRKTSQNENESYQSFDSSKLKSHETTLESNDNNELQDYFSGKDMDYRVQNSVDKSTNKEETKIVANVSTNFDVNYYLNKNDFNSKEFDELAENLDISDSSFLDSIEDNLNELEDLKPKIKGSLNNTTDCVKEIGANQFMTTVHSEIKLENSQQCSPFSKIVKKNKVERSFSTTSRHSTETAENISSKSEKVLSKGNDKHKLTTFNKKSEPRKQKRHVTKRNEKSKKNLNELKQTKDKKSKPYNTTLPQAKQPRLQNENEKNTLTKPYVISKSKNKRKDSTLPLSDNENKITESSDGKLKIISIFDKGPKTISPQKPTKTPKNNANCRSLNLVINKDAITKPKQKPNDENKSKVENLKAKLKMHSRFTQTTKLKFDPQKFHVKTTNRSIQTDVVHCVSQNIQTESSILKSELKNEDILDRMKQIDIEIQLLIQEKFKLYNSFENSSSSQNILQQFGMSVVNYNPYNVTMAEGDISVDVKPKVEDLVLKKSDTSSQNNEVLTQTNKSQRKRKPNLIEKGSVTPKSRKSPAIKSNKRKLVQNNKKAVSKKKCTQNEIVIKECSVVILREDLSMYENYYTCSSIDGFEDTLDFSSANFDTLGEMELRLGGDFDDIRDGQIDALNITDEEFVRLAQHLSNNDSEHLTVIDVPDNVDCTDVDELNVNTIIDENGLPIIDEDSESIIEEVIFDTECDLLPDKVLVDVANTENTTLNSSIVEQQEATESNTESFQPPQEQAIIENDDDLLKTYDYDSLTVGAISVCGHGESIISIECYKDNFLAASADGNVYYYSGRTGQLLKTLRGSNFGVTCLYVVQTNYMTIVYAGSLDSRIRTYDLERGIEIGQECNVLSPIQCMDKEWNTIFVGTRTGFVLQFDCKNNTLIPVSTMKFSEQSIMAIRAIKEGPRKVLLVAARSENVTIKDANTGLLLRTLDGPKLTVFTLLFECGNIYCGTSGPQIMVFDFTSGASVGVSMSGKGAVCLRAAGGLMFAGCYDGCVYVYRLRDARPLARLRGPNNMLLSLAVIDSRIIVGYKDKSLFIWKIPPKILQDMVL